MMTLPGSVRVGGMLAALACLKTARAEPLPYEENGVWLNGTQQVSAALTSIYSAEWYRVGNLFDGVQLFNQSISFLSVQDAKSICSEPEKVKLGFLKRKHEQEWLVIQGEAFDYFWKYGFGECQDRYHLETDGFAADTNLACTFLSEKVIVVDHTYVTFTSIGSVSYMKSGKELPSSDECIYLHSIPLAAPDTLNQDTLLTMEGENFTSNIYVGSSLYADYYSSIWIQIWFRGVLACCLLLPAVVAFRVLLLRLRQKAPQSSGILFILFWNCFTMTFLAICVSIDGFGATNTHVSSEFRFCYFTLLYGQNCGLDLLMAGLWSEIISVAMPAKLSKGFSGSIQSQIGTTRANKRKTRMRKICMWLRTTIIMFGDLVAIWALIQGYVFFMLALAIGLIQISVGIYLIYIGMRLQSVLKEFLGTHDDENLRLFLTRTSLSGRYGGLCSLVSFAALALFPYIAFVQREVDFLLLSVLVFVRAGSAFFQVLFCFPNELLSKSQASDRSSRSSSSQVNSSRFRVFTRSIRPSTKIIPSIPAVSS